MWPQSVAPQLGFFKMLITAEDELVASSNINSIPAQRRRNTMDLQETNTRRASRSDSRSDSFGREEYPTGSSSVSRLSVDVIPEATEDGSAFAVV
jgi:hypothetical protein